METKEYHTVEGKEKWGDGPWVTEPDKKQWQDAATGLPCLIVRNPGGALCGYVGVSEGHKFYRIDYDNVDLVEGVHGGLTFANMCSPSDKEGEGICHVPGPGEPDHVWWLGFDCSHLGDYNPAFDSKRPRIDWNSVYRDINYVTEEVTKLAQQLKEC